LRFDIKKTLFGEADALAADLRVPCGRVAAELRDLVRHRAGPGRATGT
jgi:hypothetical protein